MRNRIGPLQGRVIVFGQTEQKETGNEPGNERIARHGRLVACDANRAIADGNHAAKFQGIAPMVRQKRLAMLRLANDRVCKMPSERLGVSVSTISMREPRTKR